MGYESKIPGRHIAVTAASGPKRLDLWLVSVLPGVTRRQVAKLVASDTIAVNGRPARKSLILQVGDEVYIRGPLPRRVWPPRPDPSIIVSICYEEAGFTVVDKPSGIPSVPLDPEELGTLAGAVVARFPECAGIGRAPGDGGLLQRLDRDTSGVVLVARSQSVHNYFLREQRAGRVTKTYLALVGGGEAPLPSRIDTPLVPVGPGRRKMGVSKEGTPAATAIEVVEIMGAWRLVAAQIHHGARHQIRAHLAGVGAPIAGDGLYGPEACPKGLDRIFLHAHEISFVPPESEERVTVRSPLPPALSGFLAHLRDA